MTELLLELQAELQELAAIKAEAIGWLPLGDIEGGQVAYLHVGDPGGKVVTVVGTPDAGMAGMNVLWVG